MPNMNPGDRYRITAVCVLDEQASLNRTYWKCGGIDGGGNVPWTDVARFFATQMSGLWTNLMANTALYKYTVFERCSGILPLERAILDADGSNFGLAGPDPLPRQCCALITRYTAFKGKKGTARTYLPFPSVLMTTTTNGKPVWIGTITPNFNNLINFLTRNQTVISGANTVHMLPVVHALDPLFDDQVTSGIVGSGIATQRRRSDYGKSNKA